MVKLTTSDWREIYYAVETKLERLRRAEYGAEFQPSEDVKWIAQLERISHKIGEDGLLAALRGVQRSRSGKES